MFAGKCQGKNTYHQKMKNLSIWISREPRHYLNLRRKYFQIHAYMVFCNYISIFNLFPKFLHFPGPVLAYVFIKIYLKGLENCTCHELFLSV